MLDFFNFNWKTSLFTTLKVEGVILLILSPFIISMLIYFFYFYKQGYRMKKGITKKKMYHGSIVERIFWDFPKQFILDKFNKDPDEFEPYGFRMICGEQGRGKTITLVYLLMKYQEMYPYAKTFTNLCYKYEDGQINSWRDMINYSNGKYGCICVLDEVQNWFSSLQSKDFPPEMLTEITQQRKQRKVIFGTSQVFTRTAKPIREQTYLIYDPLTIFGCITIVRKKKPILDDSGTVTGYKHRGMFFFVHTPQIRSAFDTYKKIIQQAEVGFKPANEQLSTLYRPTEIIQG